VATANGEIHVAPVVLREVRLDQFTMQDVDAVVLDTPLAVSLLGMSFLKRLEGYEIRDGDLIVSW
jgi:aspartyl protease family protein